MTLWQPESERDIIDALTLGDVRENRRIEFKRQVEGKQSDRKEAAADLASLAIDGGVIVYGVSEDKAARRYGRAPFDLADEAERLEGIAQHRIDPPLTIRPLPIGSEEQPGLGYLRVTVPQSALAPHMVDGRYWGRDETTKKILSDAEIRRFHERKEDEEARLVRALSAERARQPENPNPMFVGVSRSHYPAVYLVATPSISLRGRATSMTRHANNSVLFDLFNSTHAPGALDMVGPHPANAGTHERRSSGAAMTNLAGGGRRIADGQKIDNLIDLELTEDAELRVFASGVVRSVNAAGDLQIIDALPLSLVWKMLGWTEKLSHEIHYFGSWGLGVLVDNIEGYPARALNWPSAAETFDAWEYRETTLTTVAELEDHKALVFDRLCGRLANALAVREMYPEAFPAAP